MKGVYDIDEQTIEIHERTDMELMEVFIRRFGLKATYYYLAKGGKNDKKRTL